MGTLQELMPQCQTLVLAIYYRHTNSRSSTTKSSIPICKNGSLGGRERGYGKANVQNKDHGRAIAMARRCEHGRDVCAWIEETTLDKEEEERTWVYATMAKPRLLQEYARTQVLAKKQGKRFILLVDNGSTHCFLSPKAMRKLKLDQNSIRPVAIELKNEEEVIS